MVIYNKADGTVAAGPFALDSLGTGACANAHGDPIVLYDRLAGRWLLSEFTPPGTTNLCVYVSQTADPISGGWFGYQFPTPDFPDYPKYAVWPDAYYVSTNESSPAVYALDRAQMLTGGTATSQRFTAPNLSGFSFQALTPSDLDGAAGPPSGAPGYFIRHRDDESHNPGSNDASQDFLEIWEFDVDFATPGNSTFTGPTNIAVSEFDSDLCGLFSFDCFPQPGTTTRLDPLREVVMWRSQYRNFGTHETLVGNLVTDVDGTDRGGIRWFELRRTGGAWSLFQEGTYSPDATHRWMGSIAMDGAGNIALGYNAGSSTVFPGVRYTGRLSGDTLGTMPQVETTIVAGSGSNSSNRWGDYSSMNVDPADDCTFWHTNEYGTSSGTWNTQIASFRFSSCAVGPSLPTLSINDVLVIEGDTGTTNATFTVTQSETSTQTVTVGYTTADGTAQAPATTDIFSNTATIAVPATGSLGTAGPYPSTITVPTRAAVTKATVTLTLSHTWPEDVDILLVGPTGQSVVLLSDVGGDTDAVNVVLTFDDTGPAVPTPLSSGTFQPTNSGSGDNFPSPAPQDTPGTSLSVFNGTDPTGTWSLYAVDDVGVDAGSISGWSLGLQPATGTGDYTPASGMVSFGPGVTTQTLTVGVLGDLIAEANETFVVNLSGAVNATIADAQGVATIVNDEGAGPFVDPLLTTGDPIRAVHITELRTRINALRTMNSLQAFAFMDTVLTAGVTVVRAVHLVELRTALNEAYAAALKATPTYTDSTIVVQSTLIRVVHITELRTAVVALEGS